MTDLGSISARLALAAALAAAGTGPARPDDEPVLLVFETRLHGTGGPLSNPEAEVTFRLTDAPHWGRILWTQGPQRLPLRDGFLRALLGEGAAPLTLDLLDGGRWLDLECDGCAGRRRFRIVRRGEAVSILGAERPDRPGPAAAKPWLRNKRLHDQRAYPSGIVPAGRLAQAYLEAASDPTAIQAEPGAEVSPASLPQGSWVSIGPSKVTGGQTEGSPRGDVSGRVNSIAVHPADPNVAYACGAQGGVWKTTDGGASWTPLTDHLPSLATGAVALAPSNPDVVYLGTGEANFSLDSYWGAGLFRSDDAGATWAALGPLDPNRASRNAASVAALAVHPSDPDVVLAAVGTFLQGNRLFSGGVYRTADGGASWTRTLGPGMPPGAVVASDLIINPSDPNVVYAALGFVGGSANNGIYMSTDGGVSFTKLLNGLPASNVGRINLALARGNTQVLYAAVQNSSTDALLGIWRTLDGGDSWASRNAVGASCSAQCWYDMALAVSPLDQNVVFFGGVKLYRSTNGAGTFSAADASSGATGGLHVDHHALVFSASHPEQLWSGNDGGVWRTDAARASLPLDWVNRNGNLGLLQFQSVAVPPSDPNIAYGGTQDNGTNKYTGSTVWTHVDDGDGGQTAVDFLDPRTVYHTFFNVSFRRSDSSGAFGTWASKQTGLNTSDRSQFYVPVEMDPTNPAVLYLGTFRLYRTQNRGDSWGTISGDLTADPNLVATLTAIGVAKTDANVIYAGASNGRIQVTSNLGGAWADRTAPPLPRRFLTSIAVHPGSADVAYAAFSGFDDPNTGAGHVFKTEDRGLTWTDTTGNLPDVPVSQVTIDPAAPQMIYLATDLGVYASTNGGGTWRRFASGFPNVAVFEVAVQQPNVLFAATHGRGMFQALGCGASGTTDADADGVADFCDNCAGQANPSQTDSDRDGSGPPCDCADADPARNPGAPEACNGLDDDCDGTADQGSAPPGEITGVLEISQAGGLTWAPALRAEQYNVYRGTRAAGASFAYDHACLAPAVPGLSHTDAAVPSGGGALYYLVSSENCLAESGFGPSTSGPRPNPSPCP